MSGAAALEQIALAARAARHEELHVVGEIVDGRVVVEGAVGEAQTLARHIGVQLRPAVTLNDNHNVLLTSVQTK